jgi:hypothetical protein
MQSSTGVMCRAMVMLACLVVIPLLALFGDSLPDLVTKLLDRIGSKSAAAAMGDAPNFMAADATAAPNVPPPLTNGPRVCFPNGDPSNHWRGDAAATPADRGTIAPPASLGPATDTAVPVGYNSPIGVPTDSNAPAGVATPASPPSWQGGPATQTVTTSPTQTGGAFVEVQERLRGLGATYYRLESWGTEQRLFRFQCAMMLGGAPNLTQHFEATDNDPMRAMSKVLADVEAWKSRR